MARRRCVHYLLPDGKWIPECRSDGETVPVLLESSGDYCPCCGDVVRRGVASCLEVSRARMGVMLGGSEVI